MLHFPPHIPNGPNLCPASAEWEIQPRDYDKTTYSEDVGRNLRGRLLLHFPPHIPIGIDWFDWFESFVSRFLSTYLMLFAGLMLFSSSGLPSRRFLFSIRACLVVCFCLVVGKMSSSRQDV